MTTDALTTIKESLDEFARLPNGVEQIRRALMSAAFVGRLVSRRDSTGSVDLLLEQLAAERGDTDARWRRMSKPAPEGPFQIPSTWRWVYLGDCASRIEYGYTASAESSGGGPHMVRITDLKTDGIDWSAVPFCSISVIDEAKYRLASGDLLFARTGGTVGKSHLYRDDKRAVFASYLIRLRALPSISVEYLALWLKSPDYWRQIYAGATGTGQPNFNGAKLANLVMPLPPRDEQDAIVEALSDLLADLEAIETALVIEESHRKAFSLSAFRELGRHRNRLALDHVHELVCKKTDTPHLEAVIVELAVTGQLTTSEAGDEPVELLLARVKEDSLDNPDLSDGKGHALPTPFEIRDEWRWVTMGSVLSDIQAGWSPRAQARAKENDEWGVLKVSACSWGEFKESENKALEVGQSPRPELEVKPGDFLISRANTSELVARSVVVGDTPPRLMLSDKTLRLSVVEGCNPRYLNLANRAQTAREHYESEATGTSSSMKNVSQRAIRRAPIPLPPSEEQDRIVAVVDELMLLVRELTARLAM